MIFQIGWLVLTPQSDDEGNPGPKNAEWHRVNVVNVEQIPGKGKKFVTVRTSDKNTETTGTLEECTLTVRSITDVRYQLLKMLCDDGGPFKVICSHGTFWMYITDRRVTQTESDKEPPIKEAIEGLSESNLGPESHHATWVITLLEAND